MVYEVPFEFKSFTYDQALERIHTVLKFGICPLLETVEDMLAELGDPDLCFRSIQIAGTNGKTSTSRYVASILKEHGLKSALYTSPHLVEYPERMEILGKAVSKEEFAFGIAAADAAGIRVNKKRVEEGLKPYDITEFDLITVAACVVFARAQVDVVVFEVGMGGRWDATSAVKSIESVAVTGIGLDHTHILGDTLEAIAAEKAAVIKQGRTCALGVGTLVPATVFDVLLNRCREVGVVPTVLYPRVASDVESLIGDANLKHADDIDEASFAISRFPQDIGDTLLVDITTPSGTYNAVGALKPVYQASNIALAVVIAEQFLGKTLDYDALCQATVVCSVPGRFDLRSINPVILVDACHNPQSVEVFLGSLAAMKPKVQERPALLCAILKDKDALSMVELLASQFPKIYVTQTQSSRALPASELADLFKQVGVTPCGVYESVDLAMDALATTDYVALGSITLTGEVMGKLHGSGRARGSIRK